MSAGREHGKGQIELGVHGSLPTAEIFELETATGLAGQSGIYRCQNSVDRQVPSCKVISTPEPNKSEKRTADSPRKILWV